MLVAITTGQRVMPVNAGRSRSYPMAALRNQRFGIGEVGSVASRMGRRAERSQIQQQRWNGCEHGSFEIIKGLVFHLLN